MVEVTRTGQRMVEFGWDIVRVLVRSLPVLRFFLNRAAKEQPAHGLSTFLCTVVAVLCSKKGGVLLEFCCFGHR